jgi:prophage DNA circulation protein
LYPVAPLTAVHVTVTPVVDVPSVADTPTGAGTLRHPVFTVLRAESPAAVVAFTEYVYTVPGTAVVSAKVAPVAVPTCDAAAEPAARNTLYPVAPLTAVHVTVTPVVDVPSVADTPTGAGTLRHPVFTALRAESPAAVVAFTEYVYTVPGTAVVSAKVAPVAVPTCDAAAEPAARNTLYPVAPLTAVHVTVTPVVDVPSVADTPTGAGTLRHPESVAPAMVSPPRSFARTE